MKALIFLKLRQWKNAIICAFKTPAKLAIIIFLALMLVVSLVVPLFKSAGEQAADTSRLGPTQVAAIILCAAFIVSFLAVKSGRKGVNFIFSAADAQLLFTAPYKPQTLLIYGLSNQLMTSIISSVFLLFQFANLYNFGIRDYQFVVIYLAWILIAFASALIRMLTYIIVAHFSFGKKAAAIYSYLALALLAGSALFAYQQGGGLNVMAERVLAMPWLRYFPIAGWIGTIVEGLMLGMQLEHWLCLLLFIIAIPLTIVFIYSRPVDFYEDAQAFTVNREMVETANNMGLQAFNQPSKGLKISAFGINGGQGAKTFFFKQFLEKRRQRTFYLGWAFFAYLILAAALCYLSMVLGKFPEKWLPVILAALIVFLRYSGGAFNPIAFEFANPYYLLYPLGAFERCFYGQLVGLMFNVIDILPAYLLCVILGRLSLPLAILLFLLLISTSMVMTAAYLITYGVAGNPHKGLYGLLFLLVRLIFLIPSILSTVAIGLVIGLEATVALGSIILIVSILVNLGLACIAVPGMKMIIAKGTEG